MVVRSSSPEDDQAEGSRPTKRVRLDGGSVGDGQGQLEVPSDGATASPAAPATNLAEMLNLTETSTEDLGKTFDRIAEKLLINSRLVLTSPGKRHRYQILEAEFYLLDTEKHPDPFTHGEEEQRHSGRWYFHRAPRRGGAPSLTPTGYRGGTRKGLDLTFGGPPRVNQGGSSNSTARGGILLRSILRESDQKVICGPSLLVDEVLSSSNAAGLKELVETQWSNDSNAFSTAARSTTLLVVPHVDKEKENVKPPKIHTSPRIGLDLANASDSSNRISFVDRPYRYFIRPDLLASKGRVHTFAGIYASLKSSGLSPLMLQAAIAKASGLSESVVGKYVQFFQAGLKMKVETFVGQKGKGVGSSPERYLAMLGALHKQRQLIE